MADPGGTGPTDFTALREWLGDLRLPGPPGDTADKGPKETAIQEQRPAGAPTTFVVAPHGPADFTTVTAAARKAPPGARILVRPGRYEEGILLEKSLEIVGDGPCEEIVFENPDTHCLVMRSAKAIV